MDLFGDKYDMYIYSTPAEDVMIKFLLSVWLACLP